MSAPPTHTHTDGQVLAARDAIRRRFDYLGNDEAVVIARVALHAAVRAAVEPEYVDPGEAARRLDEAVRAVVKPYGELLADERLNVIEPNAAQAEAIEAIYEVSRQRDRLATAMRLAARPLKRFGITLPALYR